MTYPWRRYPALDQRRVAGARLFANRTELVRGLECLPRGGVVAEVGVAFGDFSEVLIEAMRPSRFVALDLFLIHTWPLIWEKEPRERLGDLTHEEFYKRRFAGHPVVTEAGKSIDTLSRYPDETFDVIYVDADHIYEGVKADAELAHRKIKREGVIIFNDYTMYDHAADIPYGVVPAVNELIEEGNYDVVAFALCANMFCDIAIRRRITP